MSKQDFEFNEIAAIRQWADDGCDGEPHTRESVKAVRDILEKCDSDPAYREQIVNNIVGKIKYLDKLNKK